MNKTILVVDDEKPIADILQFNLIKEGYKVICAYDGDEALKKVEEEQPDLMLLDIMLPKRDGMEVCREVRKKYEFPIIMLTSKGSEIDKVLGLEMGADDYVTKPFNPLELVARVKSQLRRYMKLNENNNIGKDTVEIGEILIDVKTHKVIVREEEVFLTPREFDILKLLAENKGIVFSMDKIYEEVWKEDSFECNNTVMVHIRKLREKIEANPRKPEYIKTVWGVGYKIEG